MKTYSKCSFTVAGTGVFPLDMLRYDECFPVFTSDCNNIGNTVNGPSTSEPIRLSSNKAHPTIDRWASFGWSVADIEFHD